MSMFNREDCLTPPSVKRIKTENFGPEMFDVSPPKIRRSVNIEISREDTGNFSPLRLRRSDYIKPDVYDEYGRNLTEQQRRQNKIPWIKVKYHNGRIVFPEEKRILNSL